MSTFVCETSYIICDENDKGVESTMTQRLFHQFAEPSNYIHITISATVHRPHTNVK